MLDALHVDTRIDYDVPPCFRSLPPHERSGCHADYSISAARPHAVSYDVVRDATPSSQSASTRVRTTGNAYRKSHGRRTNISTARPLALGLHQEVPSSGSLTRRDTGLASVLPLTPVVPRDECGQLSDRGVLRSSRTHAGMDVAAVTTHEVSSVPTSAFVQQLSSCTAHPVSLFVELLQAERERSTAEESILDLLDGEESYTVRASSTTQSSVLT